MIIQCDQCKTRFRLDDSKVTVSGVRVRCSKCKHTFAVRKEADEEESAIEETFPGEGSAPAEARERDEYAIGSVTEQKEACEKGDEINLPQESTALGQDLSTRSSSDKPTSIEDDFLIYKNGGSVSFPASNDKEPEVEESPFQWPPEQEAELRQDLKDDASHVPAKVETEDKEPISVESVDFPADRGVSPSVPNEIFGGASTEGLYQSLSETGQDQSLEDFSTDLVPPAKAHDSDGEDDFSFGESSLYGEKDEKALIEKDEPPLGTDSLNLGMIDKSHDLQDVPAGDPREEKEQEAVLFVFESKEEKEASFRRSEAKAKEDLPPLSITSRRKRTLFSARVFICIFTLVFLVLLAGWFFYRGDIAFTNIPGLAAIKSRFLTGQLKNQGIAIKNLDGTFVRNSQGADIFVIRGEAVNQSVRPSSPVRIKGYVYGVKGEVLLNGLAWFGKVLTNDQLATLAVSEIDALSGKQPGNVPREFILSPGKRIPFQIVFGHVPKGAGEFGAEVVGSPAGVP